MPRTRFSRWLVAALLITGAVLRLRQYGLAGALWLDELALARNVIDRSVASLLSAPLAYDQVAPRGFLVLEKLSVLGLGAGEWQLRLVPLAGSLAALALFPLVVARLLDGAGFLVAVALFALNVPQIHYGAQAKPYSADVAVALGLTLLALEWRRKRGVREAAALALIGAAGPWLSLPAVLVLTGLGIVLVWAEWADRASRPERGPQPKALQGGPQPMVLGVIAILWVVSSAIALVIAKRGLSRETAVALREFWAPGFPPAAGSLWSTALWIARAWRGAFALTLGYSFAAAYAALAVVGAFILLRQRKPLFLLAPIGVVLAAALAGQYPFHSRLLLFLAPALICLIASPIGRASAWPFRGRQLAGLIGIALSLPALASIRGLRSLGNNEEVRPVLAATRAAWQPGDILYVYSAAWQAMEFYGPRYGFTHDDVKLGGCYRGDPAALAREVERLGGPRRVWVLLSHTTPAESRGVLEHLDGIGARGDSILGSRGAARWRGPAAYLYQLSVLASATGPAPDHVEPLAQGCGTGPASPRPVPGVDPYW